MSISVAQRKSPRFLGYAEITTNATNATTTYADVAGLSVTVAVVARPILVTFECGNTSNNTANAGSAYKIFEDASVIDMAQTFFTAASIAIPLSRTARITPTAGTKTYKVQHAAVLAGTTTLKADANTTAGPAYIYVRYEDS